MSYGIDDKSSIIGVVEAGVSSLSCSIDNCSKVVITTVVLNKVSSTSIVVEELTGNVEFSCIIVVSLLIRTSSVEFSQTAIVVVVVVVVKRWSLGGNVITADN